MSGFAVLSGLEEEVEASYLEVDGGGEVFQKNVIGACRFGELIVQLAGVPPVDAVYDRMWSCHRNFPRCRSAFGPSPRRSSREIKRRFGPRARPACGHRQHLQRPNREVTFPLASQSCHTPICLTYPNPIHPLKTAKSQKKS